MHRHSASTDIINEYIALICAFVEMQHEVGQKKQSELMDRILIERNWQNITTYQFKNYGQDIEESQRKFDAHISERL